MIVGIPEKKSVGTLQEYSLPTSEAFTLGFQEAVADNPFNKFYQWYQQKYQATGDIVSQPDAENRVREAGIKLDVIPKEGIASDALELLIQRQREKKVREDSLQSVKGQYSKGFLNLSGGLAGSFLDPINIATAFIPVGAARYAAALKTATTPLGRATVRAGFGAAEGAIGAAVVEPLSYALSQELGDEYTLGNSLLNIAFGTALGAGLHMGVGAIGDARLKGKPEIMADPQGKIPKELAASSPEARFAQGKTALAQALTDQSLDMAPTKALLESQNQAHIQAQIDSKGAIDTAGRLVKDQAEGKLSASMEERLKLARQFDEEAFKRIEEINLETDTLKANAAKINDEIQAPKNELEIINQRLEEIQTILARNDLPIDEARKLEVEETNLLKRQNELTAIIDPKQKELDGVLGGIEDMRFYERDLNRRISDAYRQAGEVLKNDPALSQIDEMIDRQMAAKPDSRFIDDAVVEQHNAEIAEMNPETALEDATESMNEEVLALNEMAAQMGVESKDLLRASDELIKNANDYSKALNAYSLCAVRKG